MQDYISLNVKTFVSRVVGLSFFPRFHFSSYFLSSAYLFPSCLHCLPSSLSLCPSIFLSLLLLPYVLSTIFPSPFVFFMPVFFLSLFRVFHHLSLSFLPVLCSCFFSLFLPIFSAPSTSFIPYFSITSFLPTVFYLPSFLSLFCFNDSLTAPCLPAFLTSFFSHFLSPLSVFHFVFLPLYLKSALQ